MQKWEYMTQVISDLPVETTLNRMGAEGWEMVCGGPLPLPPSKVQVPGQNPNQPRIGLHAIFKRPKK